MASSEGCPQFRIILFGLNGSGVSSTGNTILGKRKLRTGISFDPVTKVCQKEMTERLGRKVHIVDTPGFPIKMGEYNNSNTLEKISEANSLLDMKTNVLLLIIPIDRFTEDHRNMLRFLQNIDGLSEHVIAIFNRVDDVTDPIPELRQKNCSEQYTGDCASFIVGPFCPFGQYQRRYHSSYESF